MHLEIIYAIIITSVIQPLHILEETLHKDTLSDGTAYHITITTCPSANNIEIVNIASIQEKSLYMTLDKLSNNNYTTISHIFQ